jgi:ATP-dependent Lon protease
LKPEQCQFQDDALKKLITDYTHEAGVRELERQIGAICRAVAAKVARGESEKVTITPEQVREILGPERYIRETRLKTARPGVVTGLAFTPTGGEILHIEATRYPGRGNVTLTSHIGEVMKESAQAAISLVRSRLKELNIPPDAFKDTDIHIHVPSGAVPKDGPSAGVAMFTAIASLFSDNPSPVRCRHDRRSLFARPCAYHRRAQNEKDLVELPEEVKQTLKFTPAETVDEVLTVALEKPGRQ